MFEGTLSSVLIVENESGQVYFVEDTSKKSKISLDEKKSELKCSKRRAKRYRSESNDRDDDEIERAMAFVK